MNKRSNFTQIEEKIQKFWAENEIFRKTVEQRPEDKPYVFYDGPPFATGLPHYGHILSSVTKDLFPRYHTMKGERVRRRWGWDCHGLPIENLVESKLKISGKKEIEKYGIDRFNQTAREMVLEYTKEWKAMIERIGRWVEFDNSYKTMDSTYMESVWWALKSIWDKGLIYEGRKVLMYCPRCETPVSNAEIQMDNSYKDVTDESVIIKFEIISPDIFKRKKIFLLAWTTTPWTLPGNVALAVGKDIEYLLVESEGENYLVAKDRVEFVFENKKYKKIGSFEGKDLEGLRYKPLYKISDVDENKTWYVALADFVTVEEGTGVVHTAVMYGEDDYNLGLELDLPQIPLLDSAGKYNEKAPEFLQGKYIRDIEKTIIADLKDRGLLYDSKPYTHSYPFCWRCEAPLIYNAISAWFIDIQKVKKRMIELNEKVNWYPQYLKEGRFLNILKSAPDWNISRNRYWATPLPFWKCENKNCTETVCIGSVAELKERAENFADVYKDDQIEKVDLHRPNIDKIRIKCKCGSEMTRIEEVVDCWVESASMPFAEWHYPFENKEVFENRFPGQFIGEYIAQTRAWFYYMHAMGTLLFDDITYENVVSTGTILSEKGEKLSKSKKNFPDPWLIIEEFGADALRFYLMSSVVMQAENLFFNKVDLKDIYSKVINTGYNVKQFFHIYSANYKKNQTARFETVLDKWILSRLNQTISEVTKHLENYDTVRSSRNIKAFIDDLSLWWVRRSRDRFKDGGNEGQEAFSVLEEILKKLSLILSPFTPYMAEEIYQNVRSEKDPESVHLDFWPKAEDKIEADLIDQMEKVRKVVELGHSLRSKMGIKVRQPLSAIEFNLELNQKYEKELEGLILDELNIEQRSEKLSKKNVETNESDQIKIKIDFEITEELQAKGDLREIIRAIQSMRKKAGLKPEDKIGITIEVDREDLDGFLKNHAEKIKETASLDEIRYAKVDQGMDVATSKGKIKISLSE